MTQSSSSSSSSIKNQTENNNNARRNDTINPPSNGSASSWLGFWKTTPSPQPSTMDSKDNINTTETPPPPNVPERNILEQKNNGQSNSDSNDEPGLWSWLGYSSSSSVIKNDTSSLNNPVVEEDNDKTNTNNIPEETTTTTTTATTTTTTTSATTPTPTPPPIPSRPSSWQSYFFPNNTQRTPLSTEKDSVIVEPTTKSQDELLSAPNPPPARKWTQGDNIVLPSIQSQFTTKPQTLFYRAVNAIHSMFSSNPGKPVADLIKEMKAQPETAAGKKFVVIGIHGWFPTKLVRSVMGEPTGTSSKFCEQMTKAVRQYFEQDHGLILPVDCITQIPLQWEGKVQERVDKLYSVLVNDPDTLKTLQSADTIFWTTHSQGTPVSAMLLDRLIRNKIVRLDNQHICLLAMAGIAHGPFASLRGNLIVKYFEADAARELFDFMDPASDISQTFQRSMSYILQQGIKTVLIGSMEDQVVPLYSAIMVGTDHPNILRALYIDGHIYSPDDFLINLILFALRLRNAGLSDHGLLLHLSDVLAGNLYSWEGGHSTIYEETSVYELAPQYLFDTAPLGDLIPTHQEQARRTTTTTTTTMVETKSDLFKPKLRLNPFYLTWAMRGVFDDPRVIQVFGDELDRLRGLFQQWNPKTARLREIKFRLEPIKARL